MASSHSTQSKRPLADYPKHYCPTCSQERLCSLRIPPPDGSALGDLCVLPLDHAGPCRTFRDTHDG